LQQITVFGISTHQTEGKTEYVVSSLSPAYNPIQPVAGGKANPGTYNPIAAAGDGKRNSWVYYFKDPTGKTQEPQIWQVSFNLAVPGNPVPFEFLRPDPTSDLAVAYHPTRPPRMLIFQGYKTKLLFYAWTSAERENPINSTNNALEGTALATSVVALGNDAIEVYLYYIDNANLLYRVVFTGTEVSKPFQISSN
jgi:hypothetical protein